MSMAATHPRHPWVLPILIVLALLTFARGAALVLHRPLIGLANSYDEVRYSSCFDLAPVRPGVPADQFNPQAPLRHFAFYSGFPPGVCVWTSDFLFTAPVAYGWKLAEALGGSGEHSIGKLGALRWLVWSLLIAWFTRSWLVAGRPDLALTHLAWAGIVLFDPGITLMFNTWYADPAAALGLYLCGVGGLLLIQSGRRAMWLATAAGAAILASSKFQHILLPLLLALTCRIIGGRPARALFLALAIGGLLGATVSAIGSARPASSGMALANRGNFVLMILLPNVADPAQVAAKIGMDADCAARAGPHGVWNLEPPIERTCPSLTKVSSPRAWAALIAEPPALLRALGNIPQWLLPWVSDFLGEVEAGDYQHLPDSQWSLDTLFGKSAGVAWILLALPWLVFLGAAVARVGSLGLVCAAMCALVALEVPVVSMFGDGFSDFAKHAQLAVVAALASLTIPFNALVQRWLALPPGPGGAH
jgi:hypothetical protein